MTVHENLMMGGYVEKDQAKFKKGLERVYELFPILQTRARQAAGTLSGGEQQMLVIARAMMSNPKVLLMDEPTTGLSPLIVQVIAKSIDGLRHDGLSIVLVEQNVKLATGLATWCYVMELGRIVLEGPAKDISNDERIKHSYLGR